MLRSKFRLVLFFISVITIFQACTKDRKPVAPVNQSEESTKPPIGNLPDTSPIDTTENHADTVSVPLPLDTVVIIPPVQPQPDTPVVPPVIITPPVIVIPPTQPEPDTAVVPPVIITPPTQPEIKLFDTTEIVIIKKSPVLFMVYFHTGRNTANNIWFMTKWERAIVPAKFIDTWKFDEGWITTRKSESAFSNNLKVIYTGVWENAIATKNGGYTDFLGSKHGWEEMENMQLYLDDAPVDIDGLPVGTVKKVKHFSVQQSSYFKTSNGLGNIARSVKKWDISKATITINNQINWLGKLQITPNSYLSMLPVMRKNGSAQITTVGYSNDDPQKYDITNNFFLNNIGPTGDQYNPARTVLTAYGDRFWARMRVIKRKISLADGTILPNGLADAGMYIQNNASPGYNKLYGRFGSTTVQAGDVWECETSYKIVVK